MRRLMPNCWPMRRCRCVRAGLWRRAPADGSFARGGRLPVNLSGGVLTWNPVFCTGLSASPKSPTRSAAAPARIRCANVALRSCARRQRLRDAVPVGHRAGTGGAAMSADRVGIIGIGQSEFRSRRDDASYPDLVREGVARGDAGRRVWTSMPSRPWSIRCRPTRWSASATPNGWASTRWADATSRSCASTPAAPPAFRRWRRRIITSPPACSTSC